MELGLGAAHIWVLFMLVWEEEREKEKRAKQKGFHQFVLDYRKMDERIIGEGWDGWKHNNAKSIQSNWIQIHFFGMLQCAFIDSFGLLMVAPFPSCTWIRPLQYCSGIHQCWSYFRTANSIFHKTIKLAAMDTAGSHNKPSNSLRLNNDLIVFLLKTQVQTWVIFFPSTCACWKSDQTWLLGKGALANVILQASWLIICLTAKIPGNVTSVWLEPVWSLHFKITNCTLSVRVMEASPSTPLLCILFPTEQQQHLVCQLPSVKPLQLRWKGAVLIFPPFNNNNILNYNILNKHFASISDDRKGYLLVWVCCVEFFFFFLLP